MKIFLYTLLICSLIAGCNAPVKDNGSNGSKNPYGLEIVSEKAVYDSLILKAGRITI
ncbi:MAG: hypothetical protein U5Q03_13095 [Bacteroidota bacterium]|nr:hypothetical protein [Bacteroidota bacterium]